MTFIKTVEISVEQIPKPCLVFILNFRYTHEQSFLPIDSAIFVQPCAYHLYFFFVVCRPIFLVDLYFFKQNMQTFDNYIKDS